MKNNYCLRLLYSWKMKMKHEKMLMAIRFLLENENTLFY